MPKCTKSRWCCKYLFLKIFFFSILLQYSLSFDIFEGGKPPGLIALSPQGREELFAALEEKKVAGDMMAYPRVGRRFWELTKTLIPYPRAGRVIVDPEDYDILLNVDNGLPEVEDSSTDTFLYNHLQKRKNMKLIPRIGRKKRSIPDDTSEKHLSSEEDDKEMAKTNDHKFIWNGMEDYDGDDIFATDKKSMRSKSSFYPRIGKKRSDYLEEYLEGKRAVSFTPRIGRAALIPRIGRTDPRFRLKNRASFIPRIGRRAALIPRIGRSQNS